MSVSLGLELGPDVIRAVRLNSWGRTRVRTFEQHWDPAEPAEAFAALRENLGKVDRLAVTVDLSFLFAKQVRLPPLSAAEKRRILALEPERFFPVRAEELVLAVRDEDNLVFAARASELGIWLAELETIAPVDLVEAGPMSLARALHREDPGEATILMEENHQGMGIARVEGGRVLQIRRICGDPEELAAAIAASGNSAGHVYFRSLNGNRGSGPAGTVKAGELPSMAGLAPPYLAAYGAALGLGGDLGEAMLPPDLSRRIVGRRRRSVALGAIACVLAFAFALLSVDEYRSRGLGKLDSEISQVRDRAQGALALARQAEALRREAKGVAAIEAERVDLLGAIAALTRRLPSGVHFLALRSAGRDWQIDGYARESAPLVARLEEDPLFEDVHFLTATSRTQLNGKANESFSIALRLVPAP